MIKKIDGIPVTGIPVGSRTDIKQNAMPNQFKSNNFLLWETLPFSSN